MRFFRATATGIATVVAASLATVAISTVVPGVANAATTFPVSTKTTIAAGLKGFDTKGDESASQIAYLKASGYSFDAIDVSGTAWQGEYQAAGAAGLDVILFQGYDPTTWPTPVPNAASRADIIVANAELAGYPAGAQIFLNVEDNTDADGATAVTWVEDWAKEIKKAGYVPGIYVGVPQALSTAQLTPKSLPDVPVFWRSASSSAPQAPGFVMSQTSIGVPSCDMSGGIDVDVAGSHGSSTLVGASFPAQSVDPTTAGELVPVTPVRLLDTRNSVAVPAWGSVKVKIAGAGGAGSDVSAAVLNLAVVSPKAAGHITAYPSGTTLPTASNLNFLAGQTIANLATVPVGSDGTVTLYNGSTGTVELVADLQGYYLGGTATAAGTFSKVSPVRLLDTRKSVAVPAWGTVKVKISGASGVASDVSAAILNVTVVSPKTLGHVTAYPSGTTLPTVSNLNFSANQTIPNLATVPVGSDGTITLYNGSAGAIELLADLQGYYHGGTATAPGTFTSVTPTRLLDTRNSSPVPAYGSVDVTVAGQANAPSSTGLCAAALNLTVVAPPTVGYLTGYPAGAQMPVVSNINFASGVTIPNDAMIPAGTGGAVSLYNGSAGSTQFLADFQGYFQFGS